MRVRELHELLGEIEDQESVVVLSADAEGNSYSPLADTCNARYTAETTWRGDIYMTHEYIVAHAAEGFTEEDEAPADSVPAVCFWPVN